MRFKIVIIKMWNSFIVPRTFTEKLVYNTYGALIFFLY